MSSMSITKICEKIWELEKKYSLLDWEINGVKIWQLSRFEIYYQITQKIGVFTKAHTIKMTSLDMFKALPTYLYNAIFYNPLRGNYKRDILIFDHPRKKNINGKYVDIYTQSLLDELNHEKYDVIERPFLNKHFGRRENNRKYLDYLYLRVYFYIKFSKTNFCIADINKIDMIEKEINDIFNIKTNLKVFFSENIIKFNCYHKFYCKLLKKRGCKQVFLVISYLIINMSLIAAAKEMNIEVIELQHGTISPYHLGYHYPNRDHPLEYFPDTFYSFGDFWGDVVDLPIDKERIITYGFSFLREKRKAYSKVRKRKSQILVISQGVIGRALSEFILKAARSLSEYTFIYKLHPGEYDRWKEEYKDLVLANALPNVEIIDNNARDIYLLFAESEFQIGVFSTAIYEGLSFDCKTFLIDLPGIEYMEYLIDNKFVKVIKDIHQLKAQLSDFKTAHFKQKYFFC